MSSKPKFKTPYSKLLPPLSFDESAALKASIMTQGVLNPVLIDEEGNVLDGHHRLKFDPNAPTKVVPDLSTDAEKMAFVFQSNNGRRNLSSIQRKSLNRQMCQVANALRQQDPKKFTQKVVAGMIGVSQPTISGWFRIGSGNNIKADNVSTPRPDARRKVPETARTTVAARVTTGESKQKIAKELGVTQRTVSNIAKSKSQKTSGKGSGGEAQQAPPKQDPVEEALAVPAAALPGHEEEPSPTTPFDEAIAEVQAVLDKLASCDNLCTEINRLVPRTVDPNQNKEVTDWLTKRFTKALKVLQGKAAEYHEQPADDESVQDDDANPADEEDEPDLGRPSGRIAAKVG